MPDGRWINVRLHEPQGEAADREHLAEARAAHLELERAEADEKAAAMAVAELAASRSPTRANNGNPKRSHFPAKCWPFHATGATNVLGI